MALPIDFIKFIEHRLAAHEGGAPAIQIHYDDATSSYLITQRQGFGQEAVNQTLGCSRSLRHAVDLAITEKVYEYGEGDG